MYVQKQRATSVRPTTTTSLTHTHTHTLQISLSLSPCTVNAPSTGHFLYRPTATLLLCRCEAAQLGMKYSRRINYTSQDACFHKKTEPWSLFLAFITDVFIWRLIKVVLHWSLRGNCRLPCSSPQAGQGSAQWEHHCLFTSHFSRADGQWEVTLPPAAAAKTWFII